MGSRSEFVKHAIADYPSIVVFVDALTFQFIELVLKFAEPFSQQRVAVLKHVAEVESCLRAPEPSSGETKMTQSSTTSI